MAGRVAAQLRADGVPHAVAAAGARAIRGASGLDPAPFAEAIDVPVQTVLAIEDGHVAVGDLPRSLRASPLVDWPALIAVDAET
jgi:hypothetical protein